MVARRESYVDKVWRNLYAMPGMAPNGRHRQFWVECAIRCSVLSPTQRAVALAINWRQGKNSRAWPSLERIAFDTGLGRSTVVETIKELRRLEWLAYDSGAHKGVNNIYQGVGPKWKEHLVEPPKFREKRTRECPDPVQLLDG